MAARGSYAKGVAKRDEILTTALKVIAEQGYQKASIRKLAEAVKLSQTGLLHYFGTKEDLFMEVLRKRDEADYEAFGTQAEGAESGPDVVGGFTRTIRHNADVPGLVLLYTQFSAEATEPGHPAHEYFRERSANFRLVISTGIRQMQAAGTLTSTLNADHIAMLLLAASDGLQVQWLLDNSIDMAEHITRLWETLTRTP